MLNTRRRSLWLVFLAAWTLIAAPTAASSALASAEAAPAAAVVQISNWRQYESGFKSMGTCNARAAVVERIYGGTHYGAVADTKCQSVALPTCPPTTTIALFVRYVDSADAPVRAQPLSRALAQRFTAFVAAC